MDKVREPHLTLYVDARWSSPFAMAAFIALTEKGLPFAARELSLQAQENYQADYLERSLTGKVPTLVHDGFWLSESMAIVEYLEEVFPTPGHPSLLPQDVHERARARQVMMYLRTDFQALRQERPTTTIYGAPTAEPLSAVGRAAANSLVRVAEQLVSSTRDTVFRGWCIADPDLGLMLERLNRNGFPLSAKLKSYAEAQWSRPSMNAWANRLRPSP